MHNGSTYRSETCIDFRDNFTVYVMDASVSTRYAGYASKKSKKISHHLVQTLEGNSHVYFKVTVTNSGGESYMGYSNDSFHITEGYLTMGTNHHFMLDGGILVEPCSESENEALIQHCDTFSIDPESRLFIIP